MPAAPLFEDRCAAGEVVARALASFAGRPDLLILGMARGGVAVAAPVARALGAPLEVLVARKLGVPGIEEVAFGAIAEGRRRPVDDMVGRFIGVPRRVAAAVARRERREVDRRVRQYRGRSLPWLVRRTVIVVDDGVAGGATLRAAALALRRRRPRRLIAAVPVGSAGGVEELEALFDDVVAVHIPEPFGTVSDWYGDFGQIDDAGVLALVGREAWAEVGDPGPSMWSVAPERPVAISIADGGAAAQMLGDLGTPSGEAARAPAPLGLVIFAPGGGSSRRSYRNRYLAGRLRLAGWATLRLDLLLETEQRADAVSGELRFDIARLTRRLQAATEWCVREGAPGSHRIVLFGASTGAAAAAGVATARPDLVAAVVARGGRIDLAETDLSRLTTPTLLVVGGADELTLRVNREAAGCVAGPVALEVIPSAGHTFEEPGALGRVGEVVASRLDRLIAGANRRARRPPW